MAQGRKVLYFIGAGTPRGAGAAARVQAGGQVPIPTQDEFWDVFLRFCRSTKARRQIESFLFRYFLGYRRVPARSDPRARRRQLAPIDVEEVFTFLSERTRAPSSSPQLRTYAARVWDFLLQEVGNVFSHFEANARTRQVIQALYRKHVRSFDVIVSFNYDTIFESSLARKVKWAYSGIEPATDKLRILKPHGSINWTLHDGQIQRSEAPARSVVVAPTHLKFIELAAGDGRAAGYLDQATDIRAIWEEMEAEMKATKLLVFIGYSFPVADLYFSSVLRSVLADRDGAPDVVLVNPDAVALASRLQKRFPLPRVVKYFDLQQFVEAGRRGVQRAVDAAEGA